MKNNKIIYLIVVFLITLFSFNLDVDAAQELTCVYDKEWFSNKILLIQYSDGSRVIFTNKDNVAIESGGWFKTDFNANNFGDDIILDNNNLTSCPSYANTESAEFIKFFGSDKFGRVGIDVDASTNTINEPAYSSIFYPSLPSELSAEETCSSDTWLANDMDESKYTGACLYRGQLEDGSCHLVQVNFGLEQLQVTEYDLRKGLMYSAEYSYYDFDDSLDQSFQGYFKINKDFNARDMIEITDGTCIGAIRVKRRAVRSSEHNSIITETDVSLTRKGDTYYLVNTKGKNPITLEELTMNTTTRIEFIETKIDNCEDLFGEEVAGLLKKIWNFIKMLIPILLVLLGALDFAKAIFAGKEDDMKKAQAKFIKRIIIAVVLFLIPVILSFLLKVAHGIWIDIGTDICGILA